jgi:hypothetical protein
MSFSGMAGLLGVGGRTATTTAKPIKQKLKVERRLN